MYHHGMSFSNWLHGGGFMAGPLGMILALLFWVTVFLFVVKVYEVLFPPRSTNHISRSLNFVKERYADGERSRDEFERVKSDITVL